jgi:hypothetical protein
MGSIATTGSGGASATAVRAGDAVVPPGDPSLGGRLARWLPAAAAFVSIVAMLLDTHTPVIDIGRYAIYIGWGLTLPGTLLYRSLRRTPHTLVEDLAMGTTIGLVLEIGAWAAFSSVGGQGLLWLWPALVVVPFLAVPALRRHWRVTGYRPAPPGWSWAVAGVAVFFVGYVYVSYMRQTEPVPTGGAGAWYHIDLMYMLSMVGEAKHHFPVYNPQVASEPLNYHWFSYAHMASASLISGVDTPMVFFRLASPLFCVLAVLTLAVAGWRVSGKPWVGAFAAMLTFVIGEFTLADMSWGQFGGVAAYMVWSSHSMAYSWAITFALMVVVVDLLRAGPRDVPLGRGAWALLALLLIGAAGSKSTIIPVVLGGLGVAGLAHLVTRRRVDWRLVGVGGVVAAGAAFATAAIYRFETHGLRPGLLTDIEYFVYLKGHAVPTWRLVATYGFVTIAYLLFLYMRLAGIAVLARLRRPWGHLEWFLLGSVLAGGAATLFFTHPALSQNFFIRTAFGFGAVLSAMGFAALVERYRIPARTLVVVFAVIIGGVSVLVLALRDQGFAAASAHLRFMQPIMYFALALAVLLALGVAVWFVVLRRRWAGIAAVSLLGTVLLAGAPSLVLDGWDHTQAPPRWYHSHVTAEEAAAARWLRDHVPADEVIATNQHCLPELSSPGNCYSTSFWLSAYSERRQLVGSWLYVPREVDVMVELNSSIIPFWDQRKLADNDIVFTAPSAERVSLLVSRYGVHWLVADRAQGRESEELRNFADLRYTSGPIAIYQIRR